MDNRIFRKKSIDRISSPEQLNDYLKTANPGVWMILAAVLVLLAGVCVWGIFGRMDSKLPACVRSDTSGAVCYVQAENADALAVGMPLMIGDAAYTLGEIDPVPMQADGEDAYLMHIGGFDADAWLCTAEVQGSVPEGVFAAQVITESISPVSFILN